jgi:hypothetical protein
MNRVFDIVQRAYDKKFCVYIEQDDPNADVDFYKKNNLPVPQIWIPIAVTFTREAAVRASKAFGKPQVVASVVTPEASAPATAS